MGLQARNPFENDELEAQLAAEQVDPDEEPEADPIVVLTAIHHVAMAVDDLDEAIAEHRDAFGVTVEAREILEDEAVEVALLDIGGTYLQLMTPTTAGSWVAEFLEDQGPGINHVGYRVDDCAGALATLVSRGYEAIDEEPRPGIAGTLTAYVHPPDQPGTLIQLVEG